MHAALGTTEAIASDFLLTGDVARILQVSAETVRLWERIGRLHALKTDRGVRLFDRRDVEALASARRARRSIMSSHGLAPTEAR